MPVRLLGFFRMGHVSGWGTRAGAYSAGQSAEAPVEAPAEELQLQDAFGLTSPSPAPAGAVAVATAPVALTAVAAPARRRLNPQAAIPYLIGIGIFALEAITLVP